MADAFGVERPGHADFEDAQLDVRGQRLVDAQRVQRLSDVKIGLAGRNDAEARLWAVDHGTVQPVGPGIGKRGVDLVARWQPQFLRQRLVRPPDAESPGGTVKSSGSFVSIRKGSIRTAAEVSTVSAIALIATQQPE